MKKATTVKQSAADFLAENWSDTASEEILYRGKSLVVEVEIRPTEAVIATNEMPGPNSKLMEKVFKKVMEDPKFRGKLNGKKLENLGEVFENPSDIIDYMMSDEDLVSEALEMSAGDVQSTREVNKKIVMACAVNPRFCTQDEFKENKETYLKAEIKTFPVEFISDMDLQTLANLATGKHVVWEEKSAESLSNFSDK